MNRLPWAHWQGHRAPSPHVHCSGSLGPRVGVCHLVSVVKPHCVSRSVRVRGRCCRAWGAGAEGLLLDPLLTNAVAPRDVPPKRQHEAHRRRRQKACNCSAPLMRSAWGPKRPWPSAALTHIICGGEHPPTFGGLGATGLPAPAGGGRHEGRSCNLGQTLSHSTVPPPPPPTHTPGRPASNTITDRGVAMIPLPDRGCTRDWRMNKMIIIILHPPPPPGHDALMPDCGVHYLWFAFVCFLMRSPPPRHATRRRHTARTGRESRWQCSAPLLDNTWRPGTPWGWWW